MRLAVLFSGGKDSVYATHLAHRSGNQIVCLVSVSSQNDNSYMYHTPNISLTSLQAESMNIPLVTVYSKGKKENEVADLKNALLDLKKNAGIQGIITGAIHSSYQSSRIQKMCHEIGLTCFNPLWLSPPRAHWHELVIQGFEVMLVRVAAKGLEKNWLGKVITLENVEELLALDSPRIGINPSGEGGEFESLVLDAPLFSKRVHIEKWKDEWKGLQGTRHVLKAHLEKRDASLEKKRKGRK
ncbi:MAG: diphthine--ammonia ligase [Candidatus Diapherotrites archaeon]